MADADTTPVPSSVTDSSAIYVQGLSFESPIPASTPTLEPLRQVGGVNSDANGHIPEKSTQVNQDASPGVLPEDVYDTAMSWWRAGIRRFLVKNLKKESAWIGAMQVSDIATGISYPC
jgi:hypothetical protein